MAKKPKKLIPLGRYFEERRPDAIFKWPEPGQLDGHYLLPGRLSWSISWVNQQLDYEILAQSIGRASRSNTVFFLDTGIFTVETPTVFWEALFDQKIIITPGIREELQPWLINPFANFSIRNMVARALTRPSECITFDFVDDTMKEHGYLYYMNLLTLRKYKGYQIGDELSTKLGRPPSRDEFHPVAQAEFGNRGEGIAWKGWKDWGKTNYCYDEQLVVMAVLSSILSGNQVAIMTRDTDIAEQFYKLIYLIDTHYRSTLFAEAFFRKPQNYHFQSMLDWKGREVLYCGEKDLVIDPDLQPPLLWRKWLPELFTPIPITCWTLATNHSTISEISFMVEMEMSEVLKLKGSKDGSNTDLFQKRNCHILPFPLTPNCSAVAIAEDARLDQFNYKFRKVDMIHACNSVEGHSQLLISDTYKESSVDHPDDATLAFLKSLYRSQSNRRKPT